MSVQSYFKNPVNGFTAAEQSVLTQWEGEFAGDPALRLIRRNFDRDCDRSDILQVRLRDFLHEIAAKYHPAAPDGPLTVIDQVYTARRSYFLLPGRNLSASGGDVARVMRVDHLIKYHLHTAGIAITRGLGAVVSDLQTGKIKGRDLSGSHMGRTDHPVWVCPAGQLPPTPDACRDELGLHHIHHGHLASITYPDSILRGQFALHAPTTIDSAATGANNWIFAKRKPPGGPDWGHTVDLNTGSQGIDEAVHRDFPIDASKAGKTKLGYVGAISSSPAKLTFSTLLSSI